MGVVKTTIKLERFAQEFRVFVEPADFWRLVQIVVPSSPTFKVINDKGPKEIGYNRHYKVPALPAGQMIEFPLAPGQFLTGCVTEGHGELAVITSPCPPPTEAAARYGGD